MLIYYGDYRNPSAKAPVIDPGDEAPSLCGEMRWREGERTRMLDRGDPACYDWNRRSTLSNV